MLQDISDCEFRRPSGRGGTVGRLCGAGKRGQEGGAVLGDPEFYKKCVEPLLAELDVGIDEICAFEMTAIVDDPELYAVFLKYCGKD